MVGRFAAFLLALACGTACSGGPAAPSLVGQWGGDHVALTVSGAGNHAEFDCAHGDFPGALTAPSFQIAGTFVREHGGPIAVGEVADSHPAFYAGSVSGGTMTLTVRLTDTSDSGTVFTLTRGNTGRVVKCL